MPDSIAATTAARGRGTGRWLWVAPAALLTLAGAAYLARPVEQPEPWRAAVATSQARAAGSASPVAPTGGGGSSPIWSPPPTTTVVVTGQWVEVFDTDGEGLFIRFTPRESDRVRAWPESTKLQVVGPDQQADGRRWRNVRDPDGLVGWVPAEYVRPTSPPS